MCRQRAQGFRSKVWIFLCSSPSEVCQVAGLGASQVCGLEANPGPAPPERLPDNICKPGEKLSGGGFDIGISHGAIVGATLNQQVVS